MWWSLSSLLLLAAAWWTARQATAFARDLLRIPAGW